MEDKILDRTKTYEFIDFNDTSAMIDFINKNNRDGWDIYGQRTRDAMSDKPWTQTKLYRIATNKHNESGEM